MLTYLPHITKSGLGLGLNKYSQVLFTKLSSNSFYSLNAYAKFCICPIFGSNTNCKSPISNDFSNRIHDRPSRNSDLLNNKKYAGCNYTATASLRIKAKLTPPPSFEDIEVPKENQKLPYVNKVPNLPFSLRPIKMPKNLMEIRGEEEIHTNFVHNQYGIVAQQGGYLKYSHFEMIRMGISRRIDTRRMFAIWRVDAPWKSKTKKGTGKRMGSGKGNINHYVTPVKAKRVIMEVAGKCTFSEVKRMLDIIAKRLPFPAKVMSQEMIEAEREREKQLEKLNKNPYTFKYLIQNNMLGFRRWAKKDLDLKYFGKYD